MGKIMQRTSLLLCVITFFVLILNCPDIALADETVKNGYFAGNGYDLSEFNAGLGNIFSLAKAIALPLAAISIAIGAFNMFVGDEQKVGRAKTQILYTFVAVAVIYLLPLIIQLGVDIGRANGWLPSHNGDETLPKTVYQGDFLEEDAAKEQPDDKNQLDKQKDRNDAENKELAEKEEQRRHEEAKKEEAAKNK